MKHHLAIMLALHSTFFSINAKRPLKVQCFGRHFAMLYDLADKFEKEGLIFVDKNPDVLFCNDVDPKQLKDDIPIILFEKKGSPSPAKPMREALKNSTVKGLFKNSVLRTNALYKEKMVQGSYHWMLTNKFAHVPSPVVSDPLSEHDFKKIYCMPFYYSSIFSKRFKELRSCEIDFDATRPIDVFFAGKLRWEIDKYGHLRLFGWHRKHAIDAIRAIPGINAVVLEGDKPLPFDLYIRLMKLSKIVVSPWGEGPWCFRDCEAMFCGAVLVKPDTSFLKCYPDMFINNETYIPCRPDFSNLQEIVKRIVSEFEKYKKLRIQARKIQLSVDEDSLVKDFSRLVKEVLKWE